MPLFVINYEELHVSRCSMLSETDAVNGDVYCEYAEGIPTFAIVKAVNNKQAISMAYDLAINAGATAALGKRASDKPSHISYLGV